MDTRKLAKIIKLIVEQELERRLPKLVEERVNKVLKENKQLINKRVISETVEQEIDPFLLANSILDDDREYNVHSSIGIDDYEEPRQTSHQVKQYTKNPVLNEILNKTRPFTSSERNGGTPSVLDNYQELNENFNDMDKTVSFDTNSAQGGMDVIKSQMAAKMGYGGFTNPNGGSSKTGLGVTTGLPGLDRILNRDNSELVKRFKTRK